MISLVLVLLVCTAFGAALDRGVLAMERRDPIEGFGRALLLGIGGVGALSLAADALGLRLRAVALAAAASIAVLVLLAGAWRRRARRTGTTAPERTRPLTLVLAVLFAAVAVVALVLMVRSGWMRPTLQFDALTRWMFKAKVLAIDGTLFGPISTDPAFGFTHQRYPPLVAHVASLPSLVAGSFDDRIASAVFPWYAVGATLIVYGFLRRRAGVLAGTIGAAWVATLPLLQYIEDEPPGAGAFSALADAPFAAFLAGAALAAADAADRRRPRAALEAGLFLGFAALTKNEGIPLVAIVPLALLVSAQTARIRTAIVPFAIGVLLFVVLWGAHASAFPALDEHYPGRLHVHAIHDGIGRLPAVLAGFAQEMTSIRNWNFTWPTVLALLLVAGKATLRGGRRALLLIVLGQLASYVFALVITGWTSPHVPAGEDPVTRLMTLTLGRLLLHVAPAAIALGMLATAGEARDACA